MNASGVLERLAAAGVSLQLESGELWYECPEGAYTEGLRDLVRCHRAELVALLSLSPEGRETWEERAAIMEHEGGLTREDAETWALAGLAESGRA